MKTLLLLVLLSCYIPMNAQTSGYFIDKRNDQTYKTVTYDVTTSNGEQQKMTWMAENLNFKIENSYCYDDYSSNCEIMGRLYIWSAAMKACPQNWHVPDNEEWYKLADLFGGISSAGIHLKSTSELWEKQSHSTNKSLFNAMPYGSGVIGDGFYGFKHNGIFWSSNEKNGEDAWDWKIVSGWNKIQRWEGRKDRIANSVRCVKDY